MKSELAREGEPRSDATGMGLPGVGQALSEAAPERILLELGRELAYANTEEDLLASAARAMKALFPSRPFCIRTVDPYRSELSTLYAEGRLRDEAPRALVIKRSAVEKMQLRTERLDPNHVVVEARPDNLFEHTDAALSVPLVATGQLFGAINLEYPRGARPDLDADHAVLVQLANQVAVSLRNVRLIAELTTVRQNYEELIAKANALILVVGADRSVKVFNERLEAITGRSAHEVLGIDLRTLVPDDELLRFRGHISGALGGHASSFEVRLRGRDGEVPVSFSTSALRGVDGRVEAVVAVGQDLSAERALERRIIQAEKMVSLGQLAASVAHEINNPMTSVVGYVDSLIAHAPIGERAPSDEAKLKKIADNAERVLRFTSDLVSYARPAKEAPQEAALETVIERALGFCEHVLRRHRIQVTRRYGEVPPVQAIPADLVQVFVNLVTNACHAMEDGGEVSIETWVAEAGRVAVRVGDTGPGIPEELQERIFEPFFTTKPEGRGTGLGLSIVNGIVERHGGTLTVESRPGEGTRFTIELPGDS